MKLELIWAPCPGSLDVRSKWADCDKGSYTVHAVGIDLAKGCKTFLRETDEAELVQVRRDGGEWVEVGYADGECRLGF